MFKRSTPTNPTRKWSREGEKGIQSGPTVISDRRQQAIRRRPDCGPRDSRHSDCMPRSLTPDNLTRVLLGFSVCMASNCATAYASPDVVRGIKTYEVMTPTILSGGGWTNEYLAWRLSKEHGGGHLGWRARRGESSFGQRRFSGVRLVVGASSGLTENGQPACSLMGDAETSILTPKASSWGDLPALCSLRSVHSSRG